MAQVMTRDDDARVAPAISAGERLRRFARSKTAVNGVPIVVYGLLSFLPLWSIGLFDTKRSALCGCEDTVKESWFLAWTAHALVHGFNPFFSGAENYPFGVNLAVDTAMPILGLVTTPITLAIGPVASFNFLLHVAFLSSAAAMFFVLRHWKIWWPAAFIAGLFYGFSPYVTGQTISHLNLSFVPLPPIILAVLYEIVADDRRTPRRLGLLLGGLCAAQYLISSEILADVGLLALIGIVTLVVCHPRVAAAGARRVLGAALWSLPVFLALAGYPIGYFLFGAQHLNGPAQTIAGLGGYRVDLFGAVFPTTNEVFGPTHWMAVGSTFVQGSVAENGSYLGIPLICLTMLIIVYARRRGTVLLCGWLALWSYVIALGPTLNVDNRFTAIALPFNLLERIPLLQIEVPARYTLELDLFVAVILGLGIDAFFHRASDAPVDVRPRRRMPPIARATIGWVLVGVALFPLVPHWPVTEGSTVIPSYFTSGEVNKIPAGSVVLTYPYPYDVQDYAMLWQADTGFRFRIIGVYGNTPKRTVPVVGAGNPGGGIFPPVLIPSFVEILFQTGYYGLPPGQKFIAIASDRLDAIRQFFLNYQVGTVILDPIGAYPNRVAQFITEALGTPPVRSGGVEIWYEVARAAAHERALTLSAASRGVPVNHKRHRHVIR